MISGVYVPLLTAFAADGRVDPGACAAHASWLADAGVAGLVPFGTSGEGPSLSLREKRSVLDALAAALPGVPLLPAITEASLDGALQLVEAVNDLPAAGVLLLPPFYYRPLPEDGLRRFAEQVLAVAGTRSCSTTSPSSRPRSRCGPSRSCRSGGSRTPAESWATPSPCWRPASR